MSPVWLFPLVLFLQPAAADNPARIAFFEKSVRPILVEHCHQCHSAAAKKTRGGLTLDSKAALLAGGDTGPAFDQEHPDRSLLLTAIRHTDADLKMPPKGKLPDAAVAVLEKWVTMGAPWPDEKHKGTARKPGAIAAEDRNWWAFRPIGRPQPPKVGDRWAKNEIDRFVAAGHVQAKLTPAPEANRAALIRRLTYDLHGLPPTPEAVDRFVRDARPDAYEKLVDDLLASPRFGERMARFWLDLVRYADSDGYRIDDYRPNAWLYRDYVVRAFNADKPYDRFLAEQLAGDELFPGVPDAVIATGYMRHWIYEYNQRDVRNQWDVILTDVTDTTGDALLGLGMQCARCHDHKFDPILQKDYFRLRAFFENMLPRDDLIAADANAKAEYAAKLQAWEKQTADLRAEIAKLEAPYVKQTAKEAIERFVPELQSMIRKDPAKRRPEEHQLAELAYRQVTYEHERIERKLKGADKEKVLALRRKLAAFDAQKPQSLPTPPAVADVGPTAPPTYIPKKSKEPIAPGFPSVLDPNPAKIDSLPNSTGRRSALAKWLTSPENPLTARVIVNRLWQVHFGRGLAANASDFGRLGDPPSHPELLDWLARDFLEHGWSLKRLHRQMVLSATYRQAAEHPNAATGKLVDPENKLRWRGSVRRLEAEQVRDAMLAVAGELRLADGGPGKLTSDACRSIHCRIMRNARDPLLDAFDAPYWFQSAASRDVTTTPVQSLLLFNGPFVQQRARALADRLEKEEPSNLNTRIDRAYRLTFGRPPTTTELARDVQFLAKHAGSFAPAQSATVTADFRAGKIPYRDGQAAEVRPNGSGRMLAGDDKRLPTGDFTVEAYIMPRSVADNAAVRTIVSKWSGGRNAPGWSFGVTGKQSRRKPQTLVMQLFGNDQTAKVVVEAALFADHHIGLDKPYYVAAAVRFATATVPGSVTFFVKDLSNDDEPLLSAKVEHRIVGGRRNEHALVVGGRAGKDAAGFDGLIDDVRLSNEALDVKQLLFTHEGSAKSTVGFWTFEPNPGVGHERSGNGPPLTPATRTAAAPLRDPKRRAWVDYCHVLLNASEFFYVE